MAKDFMKKKSSRSLLLVDSLNLGFRFKHSGPKDFCSVYIQMVKSLATSYGCGKIILAADKGSSAFRKAILPEYKGNREELRANQTDQEKDDFQDFIQEYESTLLELEELEGYPVIRYSKIEADDIIAYICKHKEALGIDTIWIISTDRDLDLLLSDKTYRFSYINRKETSLAAWEDNNEFPHEMFLTQKCLNGDKGDNVPGIPQVGPKRAASLIAEYGNVFDIYDAIPIPGTNKYIQNLNANKEQLLMNVELMDLIEYCEEVLEGHTDEIDAKVTEYMNE